MRSAADRSTVIDDVNRLSSAGGTNLYPAMAQALSALRSTPAKLKHAIILSDGISAPADFARLTADMAAERITVSAVAVGDQADRELLQTIAQQGGGRFYDCPDPRSVPEIFAQETVMASKSALEEEPFQPQQVRATSVLRGIDLGNLPLLLGYVVTRPKATSEVILVSEKGDPLLAWWRYGLGMSLAFTSDAKSRWAAEWLNWPDFSAFWAQSVRHVMRQSQQESGQLQVTRRDGVTQVTLELIDLNDAFINQAEVRLSVLRPTDHDQPQDIAMRQSAPGTYVAEFSSEQPGAYYLTVVARAGEQVKFQQAIGTFVGYADELRLRPVASELLRQVAERTGGLVDPTAQQVYSCPIMASSLAAGAERPEPLWRLLLVMALVLWLIDVALRRADWFGI
jgi:nitrogen fixation protein FixH